MGQEITEKRVRLESPQELFDLVRNSSKYITWNELVKDLRTNSTTLKAFRRGERTLSGPVFLKILTYVDAVHKEYFLSKGQLLDKNWGARKGGLNSISKLSTIELCKKMEKARAATRVFSRSYSVFPTLENANLCELFGAMLGDGSSGNYFSPQRRGRFVYATTVSGNANKDIEYLQRLAAIFKSNFSVTASIFMQKKNCARLSVASKFVYNWLVHLGYPIGKKPANFGMPDSVFSLPIENRNRVLQGLLDTDGCVNARKDESYRYPYVSICSYSPVLRGQIKQILREQGFPAYIHAESVHVRGLRNFHKWFELIGSSNPRILNKYKEFCKTGKIVPK